MRYLLCLLISGGCGYTAVLTAAPFGAHRIAVAGFSEEMPLGLSADLTRELRERLAAGGVTLTNDMASATGVLTGTIVTARTVPSPTSSGLGGRVTAYSIAVQIRATLADTSRRDAALRTSQKR